MWNHKVLEDKVLIFKMKFNTMYSYTVFALLEWFLSLGEFNKIPLKDKMQLSSEPESSLFWFNCLQWNQRRNSAWFVKPHHPAWAYNVMWVPFSVFVFLAPLLPFVNLNTFLYWLHGFPCLFYSDNTFEPCKQLLVVVSGGASCSLFKFFVFILQ